MYKLKMSYINSKNCVYDQAAASSQWVLQKAPQQGFENTFAKGSVGVFSGSNPIRPDVIDTSSFLSGRDDILSRCNPPIPGLDEIENDPEPLTYQNNNVNELQPIYSREKKSAINLSSISYLPLTFSPSLPTPPQNVNHIIFQGWAQRGGVNTSNVIKNAWNSENCKTFINEQKACGAACSKVDGYMTRKPFRITESEAKWGQLPYGLPSDNWITKSINTIPGSANQELITSQLATTVGSAGSGSGPMYKGKIPVISNPYNRFPTTSNPFTGKSYPNSPLNNVVSH